MTKMDDNMEIKIYIQRVDQQKYYKFKERHIFDDVIIMREHLYPITAIYKV